MMLNCTKFHYFGKERFASGVISYVSKSEDDELLLPINIIKDYVKAQNLNLEIMDYGTDIDTIINAIFFYMNNQKRPYQEFLNFKQDFINMMIYDLKLLNPDRNLGNWFIRRNRKTGEIDLYPMFDNEMILGFDRDIEDENGEVLENNLEESNNKRRSAIVTPVETRKEIKSADYKDMINYLLKKYNFQTRNALYQANKFSSENLEEMLDNIEGLKNARKERVLQLFNIRENGINKIYDEFNKNEKEKS